MSLISKNHLDLRKQILLELYQSDKELSYDELVGKLEIKIRKRLTDSMTILRKRMFVDQTKNKVKISNTGIIFIKNFLKNHPLNS
jgi:hypothetical protein